MNMKIVEITEKLYKQEIDPNEAERLLLDLFAVSNRRELLIAYELKLWVNPTKEQIEIAEKIVDMYLSN